MILTKNQPRRVNVRIGETIPLRTSKGMYMLDKWLWIPTGQARAEAPEANCSGDALVRPMLEARQEKELGESLRYLRHMKMRMWEKKTWSAKMKRRSSESAKTVSDPGQPSRRERVAHEATHAQYRGWRIACVRRAFSTSFGT